MAQLTDTKKHLIESFFRGELTEEQKSELMNWIGEAESFPDHIDDFIAVWLKHYSRSINSSRYDHRKGFKRFREKCFPAGKE